MAGYVQKTALEISRVTSQPIAAAARDQIVRQNRAIVVIHHGGVGCEMDRFLSLKNCPVTESVCDKEAEKHEVIEGVRSVALATAAA
jgi:hypothetical protein